MAKKSLVKKMIEICQETGADTVCAIDLGINTAIVASICI